MTFFDDFLKESNRFSGKWDVILFPGKYNPITKEEMSRIKQFSEEVVNSDQYAGSFGESVEIGLASDVETDEEKLFNIIKYEMSFDDKNFITSKLFGLRMFPINVKDLYWLAVNKSKEVVKSHKIFGADQQPIGDDQIDYPSDVSPTYTSSLDTLKKQFDNTNILIVLNPDDCDFITELNKEVISFSDDNLNIGFLVWNHKKNKINKLLGGVANSNEVLKSIILLDNDRPDPEDLKSFAFKYNLGKHIDDIRTVHFKVHGEKYIIAFMSMFPDITIYEGNEENKKDNYVFVMEMIKNMLLGEEYVESSEK